jgi:hypothetical protein
MYLCRFVDIRPIYVHPDYVAFTIYSKGHLGAYNTISWIRKQRPTTIYLIPNF